MVEKHMTTQLPENGGPAFPVVEHDDRLGTRVCPGLTMLDWFAGQMLSGYVPENHYAYSDRPAAYAKRCYEFAAAMLAEKQRREARAAGKG